DRRIELRMGINLADIIKDGRDIYGDGVNVAARLEALAEPGGICVSRVVRDQVRDNTNSPTTGSRPVSSGVTVTVWPGFRPMGSPAAGGAVHQIRFCDQPADRAGARPHRRPPERIHWALGCRGTAISHHRLEWHRDATVGAMFRLL